MSKYNDDNFIIKGPVDWITGDPSSESIGGGSQSVGDGGTAI